MNVSDAPNYINRFSRIEFKYLLDNDLANKIRSELLHLNMYQDEHAQLKAEKKYLVYSLYLDTPVYTCYQQKMSGDTNRRKYRLRWYDNHESQNRIIHWEIKSKNNLLLGKNRDSTTLSLANKILSSPDLSLVKTDFLQNFVIKMKYHRMSPAIKVSYFREPLLSDLHPEFRITFDTQIFAGLPDTLFEPDTSYPIIPGFSIMEVKFSRSYPFWFAQIIRKYNLERISFSKYCRALEACAKLNPLRYNLKI